MALATSASVATGQTLFERPDTTPDYSSYRDIEDCQMAAFRITEETETRKEMIWYDTAEFGVKERHKRTIATSRRPDTAIQAITACLNKFDADTAQFWSIGRAGYIVEVLLMAHRDDDARRFARRFLDSTRQKFGDRLGDALGLLSKWVYGTARPVRLDEARQYYVQWLDELKDDSLYHTVDAAMAMAYIAMRVGDTALFEEAAWHAIRTNDATPVNERRSVENGINRLYELEAFLKQLTAQEGLDSVAISTTAYQLYLANTVKARVFGEEMQRTAQQITLTTVPDLVGQHYYIGATGSSPNGARQENALYTEMGMVPKGELPVRNQVNLIVGVPTYCHDEASPKWIDMAKSRAAKRMGARCLRRYYAYLRRLKTRFPALQLTIISRTYGTVGQLAPLTPAEEADTLAKLFLGHHRIPARLVVEETPIYHVEAPDGRRIDLPTPYAEALKREVTDHVETFTDKEGHRISVLGEREDEVFNRFIEILIKRASK